MKVYHVIIITFVLMNSVSSYANACGATPSLAEHIKYMPNVETIRNVYGSVLQEYKGSEVIYSDIIDQYSNVIDRHGPKITEKYIDMLEAEFTCKEIEEIEKFASTHYGKRFFERFYVLLEKINSFYPTLVENDMVEIRQKVEERTALIMQHLNDIKEIDPNSLIPVVVADRPIAAGETINTENASVRQYPSTYYTDYYIRPKQFSEVDGKKAKRNISRGAPIIIELVE